MKLVILIVIPPFSLIGLLFFYAFFLISSHAYRALRLFPLSKGLPLVSYLSLAANEVFLFFMHPGKQIGVSSLCIHPS
jgi:hypothetical protein